MSAGVYACNKAAEGILDYMFSTKGCIALSEYTVYCISLSNSWMFQERTV